MYMRAGRRACNEWTGMRVAGTSERACVFEMFVFGIAGIC